MSKSVELSVQGVIAIPGAVYALGGTFGFQEVHIPNVTVVDTSFVSQEVGLVLWPVVLIVILFSRWLKSDGEGGNPPRRRPDNQRYEVFNY